MMIFSSFSGPRTAALVVLLAVAASGKKIVYKNGELALQDPQEVGEVVLSPKPHTYLTAKDLPENWDWRDVDGQSLTTPIMNQHIPVYCGSCWNFAAMSSIADRLKISVKGKYTDVLPSNQVLINCGDAGSCNGGDSGAANKWVFDNGGIPDVSCQQYQAKNLACSAINTCMNCNVTFSPFRKGHTCFAVEEFPKIQVTEYGSATGDDEIMAEIAARGPVSCYIDANPLETYTGGICMYENAGPTNHAIALVGYGVEEDGTKYWIGRNSWGSYWGELGWFKIIRGGNFQPGTCFWAIPTYDYSIFDKSKKTNTKKTQEAVKTVEA